MISSIRDAGLQYSQHDASSTPATCGSTCHPLRTNLALDGLLSKPEVKASSVIIMGNALAPSDTIASLAFMTQQSSTSMISDFEDSALVSLWTELLVPSLQYNITDKSRSPSSTMLMEHIDTNAHPNHTAATLMTAIVPDLLLPASIINFPSMPSKTWLGKIDNIIAWTKEASYNLANPSDMLSLTWGTLKKKEDVVLHDGESMAYLTLVACMSDGNFNLTPHGGWQKHSKFPCDLSKQKAMAILAKAWNLQHLQQKCTVPRTDIPSVIKDGGIKISWPLFKKQPTLAEDVWEDSNSDGVTDNQCCGDLADDAWNDWTVPYNIMHELALLKLMHMPLCLPAYGLHGNLISPSSWKECHGKG
ncbi:hypothetical protein DACRYDRAFT_14550 [Dacryopinax primogenitus]|uniref:Uncharacterized protein n=1 Tax=Dacryopinax primogenitus (strain DJM 731) TaxID=1858805 RepID=M5GFW5_DACPD|nr:uncharacterized protein DACRYDRAFT_14550 [Dacryopinax primogenitus]EJU04503.1 hypothetical protein DACRYDRAFT_14550 [Dacryopinax primogenitus]